MIFLSMNFILRNNKHLNHTNNMICNMILMINKKALTHVLILVCYYLHNLLENIKSVDNLFKHAEV